MRNLLVRRSNRRKLFAVAAVVLSLVAFTVALETGLRTLAWWSLRHNPNRHVDLRHANYVIVCTGDSHTFGKGAPPGYDYPSQLAKRLPEAHRGLRFAVVNLGHAGSNSSESANRAIEFLATVPRGPDVIIFNAGKNNDHNFAEARILPAEVGRLGFSGQVKYLLANSRAFRLGQISVARLQQLVEMEPTTQSMRWNKVLDIQGQAEQELLRSWIRRDVEVLLEKTAPRGARIVLLNYWHPVDAVDQVFTDLSHRDRVTFLDARGFGYRVSGGMRKMQSLISTDYHPNEYGYAVIARLVEKGLEANHLIPPPD